MKHLHGYGLATSDDLKNIIERQDAALKELRKEKQAYKKALLYCIKQCRYCGGVGTEDGPKFPNCTGCPDELHEDHPCNSACPRITVVCSVCAVARKALKMEVVLP